MSILVLASCAHPRPNACVSTAAGFCLGNILKIISKTAGKEKVLETTMDKKEIKRRGNDWRIPVKERFPANATVSSSTDTARRLESAETRKFGYWANQRLEMEKAAVEAGGRGWDEKLSSGTTIFILDVKNDDDESAIKLADTTIKKALGTLEGLHNMCTDLLDIYYWFIHPPDLSFLSQAPASGVKIDVEVSLVTAASKTSYRLSEWGTAPQRQGAAALRVGPSAVRPLELAVLSSIQPTIRRTLNPPHLRKIFYVMFRERSPSNQEWEVRWTGEWMLSYCPYRLGEMTRPDDPKATSDQGFGAGRVYWHGRLVPNTRIERVSWLNDKNVVRAISGIRGASARAQRSAEQMQREAREAQQAYARNENVCGSMFMNWRAKISTDKFYILKRSFNQADLDTEIAKQLESVPKPDLEQMEKMDAKAREKYLQDLQDKMDEKVVELLQRSFNDRSAKSQLILSDRKFRMPEEPGAEPELHDDGQETSLLEGMRKVYTWIKACSDYQDDISMIKAAEGTVLTKVSFLGDDFEVGKAVRLHNCEKVSEREMWFGVIRQLRINNRTSPLAPGRRLDKDEVVEAEVELLPAEVHMPRL